MTTEQINKLIYEFEGYYKPNTYIIRTLKTVNGKCKFTGESRKVESAREFAGLVVAHIMDALIQWRSHEAYIREKALQEHEHNTVQPAAWSSYLQIQNKVAEELKPEADEYLKKLIADCHAKYAGADIF